MCLYPRLEKNRKYTATKKNGGIIPPFSDNRVLYIPIPCGKCMECRKKKAREWTVRLMEEIKNGNKGIFITLTFNNESIKHLSETVTINTLIEYYKLFGENVDKVDKKLHWKLKNKLKGYKHDNEIATLGVRLFLERWRKQFKTSVKHWLVTELGHEGTENIHLHGILWTNKSLKTIKAKWQYGYIFPRDDYEYKINYVNAKTINYICKYIYKTDVDHKEYNPIILTSAGIGNRYIKEKVYSHEEEWLHRDKEGNWSLRTYKKYKLVNKAHGNYLKNKFNENGTDETYRTGTGHKIALPTYYRNNIYTEEEKEKLWLQKLDKEERWVTGIRIKVDKAYDEYYAMLKKAREINNKLGYGNDENNWKRIQYENAIRDMMRDKRKNNTT